MLTSIHAIESGQRIVVTGGAGFLGSHLCEALVARGDHVICIDNLTSGRMENIDHLLDLPHFTLLTVDVRHPLTITGQIDAVVNLASLASPPAYLDQPIFTMTTGSDGTRHSLDLAVAKGARFVHSSTSEVYGDPQVHPQPESYWSHVNPIGPRSVYDEAKRYAEALITAYRSTFDLDTGILRIFNTYGPRMRPDDGRVVTDFIQQALAGEPLTVYGDGSQTRSLCYVDDLITGIVSMIDSDVAGPINLGNPQEATVLAIAEEILRLTGSSSMINFRSLPTDDPSRRRPDIQRARTELGWQPRVPMSEGLARTIAWHQSLTGSLTGAWATPELSLA